MTCLILKEQSILTTPYLSIQSGLLRSKRVWSKGCPRGKEVSYSSCAVAIENGSLVPPIGYIVIGLVLPVILQNMI
jgi:hypothetical protein